MICTYCQKGHVIVTTPNPPEPNRLACEACGAEYFPAYSVDNGIPYLKSDNVYSLITGDNGKVVSISSFMQEAANSV